MKKPILVVLLIIGILLCSCNLRPFFYDPKTPTLSSPTKSPSYSDTPFPSSTMTPSPSLTNTIQLSELSPEITPTFNNRYFWAGLTDEQAIIEDNAIMGLINAVKNGDKEYVADMIDYPIWMTVSDGQYWIANKQDFLSRYDKYFTGHFKEIFSNMDLSDKYIEASYHGIFIVNEDDLSYTRIGFSYESIGKIYRIEYDEKALITPYTQYPSNTPSDTFTPTNTPIGGINGYRSPTPTFTPYWFKFSNNNEHDLSTYLGTWAISRYEHMELFQCENHDDEANAMIGKKVTFLPQRVISEPGFFFDPNPENLDHIVYDWEDMDIFESKDNIPLPDDHPEKMKDPIFFGVYIDRMGTLYDFEVTKNGRLVFSTGCIYYFLDKVSN